MDFYQSKNLPGLVTDYVVEVQKQSLTDVLQNRCSENFRKFLRKTPVLETPFNKVAGLYFLQNTSGVCLWKGTFDV